MSQFSCFSQILCFLSLSQHTASTRNGNTSHFLNNLIRIAQHLQLTIEFWSQLSTTILKLGHGSFCIHQLLQLVEEPHIDHGDFVNLFQRKDATSYGLIHGKQTLVGTFTYTANNIFVAFLQESRQSTGRN